MIKINCDRCLKEITTLGALIFSPPKNNFCKKYHLCVHCFDIIVDMHLSD